MTTKLFKSLDCDKIKLGKEKYFKKLDKIITDNGYKEIAKPEWSSTIDKMFTKIDKENDHVTILYYNDCLGWIHSCFSRSSEDYMISDAVLHSVTYATTNLNKIKKIIEVIQ